MVEEIIVAVPSVAPGGLEAEMSGHFGHCDVFTLVTITRDGVQGVEIQQNVPHEQGGCLGPVTLLADKGASVLIAGGMGMRPLMGFNSAGIEVFHNNGLEKVDEAIEALMTGLLPRFGQNNACGGGEHEGGCGGH